jgi:hypothetical protein
MHVKESMDATPQLTSRKPVAICLAVEGGDKCKLFGKREREGQNGRGKWSQKFVSAAFLVSLLKDMKKLRFFFNSILTGRWPWVLTAARDDWSLLGYAISRLEKGTGKPFKKKRERDGYFWPFGKT